MKVLFLLHTMNRLRNFDRVILRLAEQGHVIDVALLEKGVLALPEMFRGLPVTLSVCRHRRADGWGRLVRALRRLRDAVRYFDRRYAKAAKLRERAFKGVDFTAGWYVAALFFVRRFLPVEPVLRRLLAWVEDLIPSDGVFEQDIRAHAPDVILVSPLVQLGSEYQVDYVKSAHALGIPVAFVPFSWDNLTNKGLMRIVPDRIFVWNQTQRWEAVELHGMPADRVAVCGAWRFDEFYEMRPRSERGAFCAGLGLDPSKPIVTYLCSSEFTSQNERDFVRRWIAALRASPDETARTCGVLVRPYPDHAKRWDASEFAGLENVAVMPPEGDRATASWGDQALYDSLHHSGAVMGLNTSAMIEAAILGKPVHSMLVAEFYGGQAGTLHFHYFLSVNGGLLHLGKDLDDHVRRLGQSLRSVDTRDEKSLGFVRAFVRPGGLDRPAAPAVVEEILRLSRTPKAPVPYPKERERMAKRVLFVLNLFRAGFRPRESEPLAVRLAKNAAKRVWRPTADDETSRAAVGGGPGRG